MPRVWSRALPSALTPELRCRGPATPTKGHTGEGKKQRSRQGTHSPNRATPPPSFVARTSRIPGWCSSPQGSRREGLCCLCIRIPTPPATAKRAGAERARGGGMRKRPCTAKRLVVELWATQGVGKHPNTSAVCDVLGKMGQLYMRDRHGGPKRDLKSRNGFNGLHATNWPRQILTMELALVSCIP
jgi:hypothetical protein